jgi:hypothetical protein
VAATTRGTPWTPEEEQRLRELLDAGTPVGEVALAMGRSVPSVNNKKMSLGLKVGLGAASRPFDLPNLPGTTDDPEALIDHLCARFERRQAAEDARDLIGVRVNIEGPFAVAHMGDPHMDDDGTNWPLLKRHVEILRSTPSMLAGNVGDYTNNWVGRLAKLYAKQATTKPEANALIEWLVGQVPWLYLIGGNHDVWSGGDDPVRWIAKQAGALYETHGVRLALNCPNGRTVTINARHDHKGSSMWNPAHGPGKQAQIGYRDDIIPCGHLHTVGYSPIWDPQGQRVCHAFRVGSYKAYDDYAAQGGFRPANWTPCIVTVIDPEATNPANLVTVLFDLESAAEYLLWLREKRGYK